MKVLLPRLAALDRRLLLGVMAAILLVAALECWLVVLRAPLAELRNQTSMHDDLAAGSNGGNDSAERIERLAAEVTRLEKELGGEQTTRSDDDTIFMLMDKLGHLGARHDVGLGSVKPGARRTVRSFEEAIFDVEARGEYGNIHDWLRDAQSAVAPLVVTGFTLRSIDEGQRIALTLKLADYRPVTVQRGSP